MTQLSDDDTDRLLCLAAGGEAAAVERLFERYRPRLKTMIRCRMDSRLTMRVDPSDVVQDTLATAHAKFACFLERRPVKFYPWLRQIAWDKLVELHRHHVTAQRRSVRREATMPDFGLSNESAVLLADQLVASDTDPLQRMARQEMVDRVRRAVERLSPSLSEAILLRYLEQLSAEEAADVVGISQAAYKQRLLRALRQLRELLQADVEDLP